MKDQKNIDMSRSRLPEELKNLPIEYVSDDLSFTRHIADFKAIGIKTYGDLVFTDTAKVYEAAKVNRYYSDYTYIRKAVIEKGFLFENDRIAFEKQGINGYLASIPVKKLNLPPSAIRLLRKHHIYCLGDLVTLDFNDILKTRIFSDERIIEFKNLIHSLGFSFPNEKELVREKLDKYRKQGITPLGDELKLESHTAAVLYGYGIMTVDDLINFGPSAFNLVGMGEIRKARLKKAMDDNNIVFKGSKKPEEEKKQAPLLPPKASIEKMRMDNTEINSRIKEKEKYLEELNLVLTANEELRAKEAKLDIEIKELLKKLEAKNQMEEETSHDRRSNKSNK